MVPEINLEIVEPGPSRTPITMRVHERGAGITEACGTGACASAWAAAVVGPGRPRDCGKSPCTWTAEMPRYVCTIPRPGTSPWSVRPCSSARSRFICNGQVQQGNHVDAIQRSTRRNAHRAHQPRADRARSGVTLPGTTDERHRGQPRRARAADRHRRRRRGRPPRAAPRPPRPHLVHRQGQGRGAAASICLAVDADTVVFDNELAPAQQYNLEKLLGRTAIDRTAVILDIFAQNAHTLEGKAQVELALLRYRLPRLRRGATAKLSQQRGGVGTRFGSGETKLEVDRRRIMRRITKLEAELKDLSATRDAAAQEPQPQRPRRGRRSSATPTPASRRCSTTSPTPACSSRTGCSPRSTRRPAACRCPAASRCCSPTRSASCATCRTD